MTYKARRTRDLQGEVAAGSGISVTKSVKPDGTKVYTLENTEPGSEYFTTERTEGGWAILNQDNNIVLASSSEFDFNEKGVTFFTKDGEPFAIVSGTKANGSQAFTILNEAGTIDLVSLSQGGIKLRYDNVDEEGTNIYPGQITLYNSNGDTNIEITTSDIYIYNNDEGNDNLIIEHSYDCHVYVRNRNGNDGVLIDTNDDQPATVKICDQNGNEILNSESLVDMVNAIIYWRMQTYNPFNYMLVIGTTINEEIISANNVRSSDYYETSSTNIDLGGDEYLNGILVNYSGLYEIGILVSFTGTGGTTVLANFRYRIQREDGSVDDLEDDEFSIYNGDSLLFTQTRIVELSSGDIICPLFETNSADILNANDEIRLSVKKLR